jgi:hypothetical protein
LADFAHTSQLRSTITDASTSWGPGSRFYAACQQIRHQALRLRQSGNIADNTRELASCDIDHAARSNCDACHINLPHHSMETSLTLQLLNSSTF